jgi:hypothetical protein
MKNVTKSSFGAKHITEWCEEIRARNDPRSHKSRDAAR